MKTLLKLCKMNNMKSVVFMKHLYLWVWYFDNYLPCLSVLLYVWGKCLVRGTVHTMKSEFTVFYSIITVGPSWPWLPGSWIYNYLCNQCLSPLMLWVGIPLRGGVLDTTLCDKSLSVTCDMSVVFSQYSGFFINKTDRHYITEILLKVALNTIAPIITAIF